MSKEPFISVIVAVFNGGKTLQRCIDSVTSQTYPHKELIVMDGGSTDGSVDILKANNSKIAYWESEPDRGIYHAWNKALDHVKGDWVYFLGADDYLWKPDVFEQMSKHLAGAASEGVRLVYGLVALVSEQGDIIQISGKTDSKRRQPRWEYMEITCTPGVIFAASLFDSYGKFDENFRIAGDTDFLLRVKTASNLRCIDEIIVAGYGCGGISTTPENKIRTFLEATRAFRKNKIAVNRAVWLWGYLKTITHVFMVRHMGARWAAIIADGYRIASGRTAFWTKLKE